ncbi:MAG: DUF3604 domain-containing protein [Parachlamydiaceae bacterium]|nr:DUF3604 domain-containing protein [Parachlamydiaceae bacterium]
MRRSICYCEPAYALAGESKTWKFIFVLSSKLPKGARLKFDLQSNGREIDWEIPTVNMKKSENVIYALLPNGKILSPSEIEVQDSIVPQFEFVLGAPLNAGDTIMIIIGSKDLESPKKEKGGNRAQTTSQRRRPFLLYIDPTGKGYFDEPEVFTMDVRGSKLSNLRILTPSFVVKNKRFDVVVRFEDEYGNLTNNAPEDTLIELSHEYIRENLNWKLFVPETGFISLPNLYFNEEGIYTIKLTINNTKKEFCSSPIKCFSASERQLFWGLLHGESDRFDSTENIENCLRHIRDDKAFNFFGVSPFESIEETPNDVWKQISQNITEFNEDERFNTFIGFQWAGEPKSEGVRVLVYNKDSKPILRKKELKSNTLKKIHKSFAPKEIISIPSFTMAKGAEYSFDQFDPDYERVVEIYNAWGSSEMSKKEGNSRPITSTNGYTEYAEGSIQKALARNCRFGFVAGGLDDRGIYGDLFESDQEQYSPGLTAIIATAQTKEAMMEAIYQRSCYATTGERIIVGLYLAGVPMGKEISTAEKPGLVMNRHLSGYVAGTTKLKTVEIIRNGKVIHSYQPNNYSLEFAYDDLTPLEKVTISTKDKKPPFAYYYLRVIQEDGHIAWSSPIWVDYIPLSSLPKTQNKRLQSKPVVQPETLAMEFDDEDEEDFDDFDDEE